MYMKKCKLFKGEGGINEEDWIGMHYFRILPHNLCFVSKIEPNNINEALNDKS